VGQILRRDAAGVEAHAHAVWLFVADRLRLRDEAPAGRVWRSAFASKLQHLGHAIRIARTAGSAPSPP
jgi:hypothetical protein